MGDLIEDMRTAIRVKKWNHPKTKPEVMRNLYAFGTPCDEAVKQTKKLWAYYARRHLPPI